jgi:hypothetical protein
MRPGRFEENCVPVSALLCFVGNAERRDLLRKLWPRFRKRKLVMSVVRELRLYSSRP